MASLSAEIAGRKVAVDLSIWLLIQVYPDAVRSVQALLALKYESIIAAVLHAANV